MIQNAPPGTAPVVLSPTVPPSVVPVAARRVLLGGSRVLLPEGAYLRRSNGWLLPRMDAAGGRGLRFLPDDFGEDLDAAIPLAPSPAMEDGEALFPVGPMPSTWSDGGAAGGRLSGLPSGVAVRVELSGEILRYRGRNWVLADSIIPSRALVPVGGSVVRDVQISRDAPDEVAGSDAEQGVVGVQAAPGETEADAIERRLRERIGSVPRSMDTGAANDPSNEAPAASDDGAAARRELPAERRLIRRRGVVVRDDDTGGWRFISVTEDGGTREPSMRIMPSSMLESLEWTIRSANGRTPILVTGRAVRYRNEHWLRLAVYELPRSGRWMAPGGAGRE